MIEKTAINEYVRLIDICKKVASNYPESTDGFSIAIRGLERGLKKYLSKYDDYEEEGIKYFENYLLWYIKTAIEFELGIDNKDTQAWSWD